MEILDLLDELEKMVLSSRKSMIGGRHQVIVNKKQITDQVDIIRRMVNDKYQMLKVSLFAKEGYQKKDLFSLNNPEMVREFSQDEEAHNIILEAQRQANEIKKEIDEYADTVLQNLKITVTKFKRKLGKLDSVIDLSRDRIKDTAHYTAMVEEDKHEK